MRTRVEGIDAPEREYGRRRRRRSRGRARAVIAAIAATVGVIAALGAGSAWYLLVRPDVAGVVPGQPVSVEIKQGASTAAIAAELSGAGVVPNATRFLLESYRLGADNRLRAGVYDLETGMAYDEVISLLVAGPVVTYVTVTVPEGWTIAEVAERVERDTGIPAEEFEALAESGYAEFPRAYLRDVEGSLQGYLFPKTYRIEEGMTARDVINMMLDQFETELAEVDVAAAEARGFSLHELVIIASMIERETKLAEERPLVSSVIHNRLDKGMRLQIDATIEYLLPGTRLRLSYEDLQIDSPYNTYRYAGLPPGPIANPGLASLKASAAPADTDYIYYVLTGRDGSHTFTVTYEEHLLAKERSREVLGQ